VFPVAGNGFAAPPLSVRPRCRYEGGLPRRSHHDYDTGSGYTPGYRFPLPAGPVSFDCTHQPASREGPKPARALFLQAAPQGHPQRSRRSRDAGP